MMEILKNNYIKSNLLGYDLEENNRWAEAGDAWVQGMVADR